MDFLKGLNPEQRRAVAHIHGPLLILAGAGSGKTRVITHRISHMISTQAASPREILAVTFTNKAAGEMKERVSQLLSESYPDGLRGLTVSTFHSYCARMLRIDGKTLANVRPGFTTDFSIYDEDNQVSLLRSIFRNLGVDEKTIQPRAVLSAISAAKNKGQGPLDWKRSARDPKTERLAKIYEDYQERLRQANALDFDDLLLESVRLLTHDRELRTKLSDRYRFLMIDEYQDTNRTQYELMQLLSSTHDNVAVVGDEDQSIYSWRGADIRNILDFERDYPNAEVIRLEQNYRSTKNILEAAGKVVANNLQRKGKWLWTESDDGERIGMFEAQDADQEAQFIADQTEREILKNPKTRVAVLYRTNAQSRPIEEALRRRGRPYVVIGGFSFYQRAEIRDVLGYLRLVRSTDDSMSLMRILNVPARGIGKGTAEQIEKVAIQEGISYFAAIEKMLRERQLPTRAHSALDGFYGMIQGFREHAEDKIHELFDRVVEDTGYIRMLESDGSPEAEGRIENLQELRGAALDASTRGEPLGNFLDNAALVAASDNLDEEVQVSLLTIHNAKGLEFPVVFLAGMEEGLFPHSRSLESNSMMEEERRLCYVGMTRAEQHLYLTRARFRRRFGGGQQERCVPSRFLKELPEELTEKLNMDEESHIDLWADRYIVRDSARKNAFNGKTYNSIENVREFFGARGKSSGSEGSAAPPFSPTASPVSGGIPRGLTPSAKTQAEFGQKSGYPGKNASSAGKTPVDVSKQKTEPTQGSLGFSPRESSSTASIPETDTEPRRSTFSGVALPAMRQPGSSGRSEAGQTPLGGAKPATAGGARVAAGNTPVSGSKGITSVEKPAGSGITNRPATGSPSAAKAAASTDGRLRVGAGVVHARYGRGTIVRREGDGDDTKLIVSFPGHGLKKLIEKFAGLKVAK